MKKAGVVVAALLCIALVVGGFYAVKVRTEQQQNAQPVLTEVQKVITKDLTLSYPKTPREVVKFYNRIITCYFKEDYTDEEFSSLVDQELYLYDDDLQQLNPKPQLLAADQAKVAEYKAKDRYIAQTDVCDSDDVMYLTDKGDEIAYVTASYFVREGANYGKNYNMYVLRKNAEGQWKILVFYQIAEPSENG